MFPKGMSKGDIKDLILEASDIGDFDPPQGDRVFLLAKFNPSKFGISEVEIWINLAKGNVIETAYPTKGTSVWKFPK